MRYAHYVMWQAIGINYPRTSFYYTLRNNFNSFELFASVSTKFDSTIAG